MAWTSTNTAKGARNSAVPASSTQALVRSDQRSANTSMRTCAPTVIA